MFGFVGIKHVGSERRFCWGYKIRLGDSLLNNFADFCCSVCVCVCCLFTGNNFETALSMTNNSKVKHNSGHAFS